MSDPPAQGPLIEFDQKTLLGLERQPVFPETIKKYTPSAFTMPGASYAPAPVYSCLAAANVHGGWSERSILRSETLSPRVPSLLMRLTWTMLWSALVRR